jgi:DNA-binding CsgD family transcriptional regulator
MPKLCPKSQPSLDPAPVNKRPNCQLFLLGWGFLTAWGLVGMTLTTNPIAGSNTVANMIASLASVLGCFVLVVCAVEKTRLYHVSLHCLAQRLVWILASVMTACSIGNQAALAAGLPCAVAACVQMLASLAYIGLMYLWFCSYVPFDPQVVETKAIWSTVLCAAVYLVAIIAPHPIPVILWLLLPLFSAGCLSRAAVEMPMQGNPLGKLGKRTFNTTSTRALVALIMGIFVSNVVVSLPSNLVPCMVVTGSATSITLGSFGGITLAAVLALWLVTSANRIDLNNLFTTLFPLATLGLFLSSIPLKGVQTIGLGLNFAAQWALYVFIWIYGVELCHQSPEGSLWRFSITRVAFDAGGIASAGVAILAVCGFGIDGASQALPYILFGSIVVLALVSTVLVRTGEQVADPLSFEENGCDPTQPSSEKVLLGIIGERVAWLSSQYGLSERESQILGFILRGYSTSTIRNELSIAKGTIDTYLHRMYQKCGVHSRQELVELAEGKPQDTEDADDASDDNLELRNGN